ncbi:c-type cytochrome [Paenibacillus sp. CC-CFT747]|nr:c-type cytochrome [Paenibacillus sp. CC-CFT747]
MKGGFGPNLQQVGSRKTKDQIIRQIEQGGGDMPGFGGKLSKEQIDILASWLSQQK